MKKYRKISSSDLRIARELAKQLNEYFAFYDSHVVYTEDDLDGAVKLTVNDLVNVLHMEF